MGETYYYHQLNKQQQAVYYAILKGVQSLEEKFIIPRCDSEELYNIFFVCGWTIRGFSGQPDFGINITTIHRI